MNSKLAIGLASLFLIVGLIFVLKTNDSDENESSQNTDSQSPSSSSRSQRSPADSAQSNFRFLKSLPDLDINNPPTFADIQSRTEHLTIEQIEALLVEHTTHEGLTGWLRSALWGELGKRNHRPSFDSLVANLEGKQPGNSSFANDQAIFAFLRGRAETLTAFDDSLDSIFEDINTFADKTQSRHWQPRTISRLFTKLTRIDLETAWELTHVNPITEIVHANVPGLIDNSQVSTLTGFFQALSTEELAASYLKKWQPAMETPEAIKAYETYQTQMNSRLSGMIITPQEETIVGQALASLSRFNPEAAVAWLAENEPNPDKPDYNRIHGMWRQLASNYPEQATKIFSRKEYLDPRRANIGWLISNDFSLLPEAIAQTEKASHQVQIIQSVLSSAGSNHVKDFFPTPEGPNRLPAFQQRYDYLLEGINLGIYPERQKEILLRSLNRDFKGKIEGL